MGGFFVIITMGENKMLNDTIDNIIELIKTNKTIRSKIIEFNEDLIDPIYKIMDKNNGNCGVCISNITNFINNNIDFINNIVPKRPEVTKPTVQESITNESVRVTPVKMSGEVFEIDATPQDYKEFIELSQAQRWIFRGLNILEKTSDGKKVWVIFLY
jgi:hypothetical protein